MCLIMSFFLDDWIRMCFHHSNRHSVFIYGFDWNDLLFKYSSVFVQSENKLHVDRNHANINFHCWNTHKLSKEMIKYATWTAFKNSASILNGFCWWWYVWWPCIPLWFNRNLHAYFRWTLILEVKSALSFDTDHSILENIHVSV